jgi:hypothetical protein
VRRRRFAGMQRFISGVLFGTSAVLCAFASTDSDAGTGELLLAAGVSFVVGALLLATAVKPLRKASKGVAMILSSHAVVGPMPSPSLEKTNAVRGEPPVPQWSRGDVRVERENTNEGNRQTQNIATTARIDRDAQARSAIIARHSRCGPVAQSVRAEDS